MNSCSVVLQNSSRGFHQTWAVGTRAIECSWFLELLEFSAYQLQFRKFIQRLGLDEVFFIDALVGKRK